MDEGKLEIPLLEKILQLKGFKNEGVIISGEIGLDSAVVDFDIAKRKSQEYYDDLSEPYLIVKSDPITFPTQEPGRYVVIVNANDIACVGGVPFGFLSTVIIPPETLFEDVKLIQEQIHLQCSEMGISILGGHTEISKSVRSPIVSGHMFGFVPRNYYIDNKLKEGEIILTVGFAGAEGTGIIISEAGNLVKKILSDGELKEGKAIGEQLSITQIALDVNKKFKPSLIHDATEGGVYGALSEITILKEVGIQLHENPVISEATQKLANWLNFNPYRLISSGLIIIAISKEKVEDISSHLHQADISFSVIGEVTKEKGILRIHDKILEKPKGDEIITALQNLERIKNERT